MGTQLDQETYLLRQRDAAEEIRSLKARIHSLERLRNTKVVIAGGVIVTIYKSGAIDQKRMKERGQSLAG